MTVAGTVIAVGAASIHEAAGRIGALPSRIRPIAQNMLVAGPAFTVRMPAGDNLWLHRALRSVRPGDVLVVDTQGGEEFGYWGEVMATAAVTAGVAGLVITGGVRDIMALKALGLPTFATGACIRGTGKDPDGDGALGVSIAIGDVMVRPRDLVVGDADGVVVIPAARASAAIAAAADRDREEASILERLRAGASTMEIYNLPGVDR